MNDDDEATLRVRFYGVHDMATGWYVQRVAELTNQFDPMKVPTRTVDILELHNVQQYLEHGLLPNSYNESQRGQAQARIPQIRSAVARYFTAVNDTNFGDIVACVGHEYHRDLLDLLGRYGAFERCNSVTVLSALATTGVHLAELLSNKKLVQIYDSEIRAKLLATPEGAEHLIRKYLQEEDVRTSVHLPPSFSSEDARELLESYVDSGNPNMNYISLLETAKENPRAGLDAKLKLRAKRRRHEMTTNFFAENKGFRTGYEVGISATQLEPVILEMDESPEGIVSRQTYSRKWLEGTLDFPSILNNFQHVFEFADSQVLLTLPSYPAKLGVVERLVGTPGKTEYRVGAAFQAFDTSTFLQTRLYRDFLDTKGIDLEEVISWFFEKYLVDEFSAANFSFVASDRGTSYLQKARHLFAEMESIATQFALFVEDGELDRELLSMGSDQVRYREIPSLLDGKYIYPTEGGEIAGILHLLFSDQSGLNYISENLNAESAAMLLLKNRVQCCDFQDHQRPGLDHLITLGVLRDTGTRVQFANMELFHILNALFTTQGASYYHLSNTGRREADVMVAKRWVTRRSSLLTDAEGRYFNYFLNAVDFTNGPQLRNKYLHGAQANSADETAHFNTYITALRLTIALVIKINDDFRLAAI